MKKFAFELSILTALVAGFSVNELRADGAEAITSPCGKWLPELHPEAPALDPSSHLEMPGASPLALAFTRLRIDPKRYFEAVAARIGVPASSIWMLLQGKQSLSDSANVQLTLLLARLDRGNVRNPEARTDEIRELARAAEAAPGAANRAQRVINFIRDPFPINIGVVESLRSGDDDKLRLIWEKTSVTQDGENFVASNQSGDEFLFSSQIDPISGAKYLVHSTGTGPHPHRLSVSLSPKSLSRTLPEILKLAHKNKPARIAVLHDEWTTPETLQLDFEDKTAMRDFYRELNKLLFHMDGLEWSEVPMTFHPDGGPIGYQFVSPTSGRRYIAQQIGRASMQEGAGSLHYLSEAELAKLNGSEEETRRADARRMRYYARFLLYSGIDPNTFLPLGMQNPFDVP